MRTRVPLDHPIELDGKPVTEVILDEPACRDIFALGDPVSRIRQKSGGFVFQENPTAIAGYHARCVVPPAYIAIIEKLSLADAIKVKSALLAYFAGRSAEIICQHCDLLVFDLKLASAAACGRLRLSELDHWIARAVTRGRLKG